MLSVVDIGNTNMVLGLHRNGEWIAHWRVASDRAEMPDEYAMLMRNLFDFEALSWADVSGVALASVVPPLTGTFVEMCQRYLDHVRWW